MGSVEQGLDGRWEADREGARLREKERSLCWVGHMPSPLVWSDVSGSVVFFLVISSMLQRWWPGCWENRAAYWDNDIVYISDRRKLRASPLSQDLWHSQAYQFLPPSPPPLHAYYTSLPCLLRLRLELANCMNMSVCLVILICYLSLRGEKQPIIVNVLIAGLFQWLNDTRRQSSDFVIVIFSFKINFAVV